MNPWLQQLMGFWPFGGPPGTTLNSMPQGAGAPNPSPGTVPPPQPNNANVSITGGAPNPAVPNKTTPGQSLQQGLQPLMGALAGPQVDPQQLSTPNLQIHRPRGGGAFGDTQGYGYA